MTPTHGAGIGLRVDLGVWTHGRWSLGLAGSFARDRIPGIMMYGPATMFGVEYTDGELVMYGSGRFDLGHWHLRAGVGAGYMLTIAHSSILPEFPAGEVDDSDRGVFPTAEAQLLVGHTLGASWSFEVGPLATLYVESFRFAVPVAGGAATVFNSREEVSWTLIAGVQRRL
jgi:hypothetical protein